MIEEIWRQYQNYYEVSNLGRVRTIGMFIDQRGMKRFLKPKSVAITDNGKGYKLLKWVTMLENKKHAYDNDLLVHGENCSNSRLTKKQVIEILSFHKNNPSVNRSELGRIYGVADSAICKIISGHRWIRVYNEFHGYSVLRSL